ncbi:Maf family protein [Candidatus Uhrbacteria bacterium]|nr:Maf family protein [Candidatus Uhrbacteria bacterium]
MTIILGSSSHYRKAVLTSMGISFSVISPDIDERAIRRDDSRQLVEAIAQAKMDAVLRRVEGEAIVITSDMVIVVAGVVREKPRTKEEAYAFLATLSTSPQIATSCTVVCNTATGKRLSAVDEVIVTFDPIPEENIQTFVESGEVFRYAGALAAEHPLFKPFMHFEGEWESLMGLPKEKTKKMIEALTYVP